MLVAWFGLASCLTFCVYWRDKAAAKGGRRRTRERSLHLLAVCGGWPGALLARQLLRHKSAKSGFGAMLAACVIINVIGVIVLLLL